MKNKINVIKSMVIITVVMIIIFTAGCINKNSNADIVDKETNQAADIASFEVQPTSEANWADYNIFFVEIEDLKTRFVTSICNDNLIWVNEKREIVMQEHETGEQSVLFQLDENLDNGNQIFTADNSNEPIEVFFSKFLSEDEVANENMDVFDIYYPEAPPAAIYSSNSNEAVINFVVKVLDCKDNKIIYLDGDLQVYGYDMITHEVDFLFEEEDDYFLIYNLGLYKYEDYTTEYLIDKISDEPTITVQRYHINVDYSIELGNEIYRYVIPEIYEDITSNVHVSRILATGENIYICCTNNYDEGDYTEIYCFNINNFETRRVLSTAAKLESACTAEGDLFISLRTGKNTIKVLKYNSDFHSIDVLLETEMEADNINIHSGYLVSNLVYENNKLLGYCFITESVMNKLMFEIENEPNN